MLARRYGLNWRKEYSSWTDGLHNYNFAIDAREQISREVMKQAVTVSHPWTSPLLIQIPMAPSECDRSVTKAGQSGGILDVLYKLVLMGIRSIRSILEKLRRDGKTTSRSGPPKLVSVTIR